MPAYDSTFFDPPAPLSYVTLQNPQKEVSVSNVPMLLDSGSDVTLVPALFSRRLELSTDIENVYELMGFDGTLSQAPAVRIEILFLNRTFRGQFLVIEQEWGVIGRNILNLLTLVLDGQRLSWYELDQR